MNVSLSTPIPNLPASPAGQPKARKAAQDFEAFLLSPVLDALQTSFAGTSPDAAPGSDTYALLGTQALASTIAAHGGIGIARMILAQWRQTKVPELSPAQVTSST